MIHTILHILSAFSLITAIAGRLIFSIRNALSSGSASKTKRFGRKFSGRFSEMI